MKRDDDYLRKLLMEYESNEDWLLLMPGETSSASPDEDRERYHVLLMMDEGLVTQVRQSTFRMTSAGHDYLDAIRSDTNWKRVKETASSVGGASLALLREIAVGYLKKELAKNFGIIV